jgi:hypothetical protein
MGPTTHLIAIVLCLFVALIAPLTYSSGAEQGPQVSDTAARKTSQGFQVTKDTGIQHVVPKKPVRTKLHRNAKGEYSWDLTGDSVDDVVKADRRLRKLLDIE